MAEFRRVMRLTPSPHWEKAKLREDSDPVTYVSFSDALEYAERIGMRLPTEFEYEYAATGGGTRRFPWGDDATRVANWPFGHVMTPAFDVTATPVPVYGLYSGVAEWTDSIWAAYPSALQLPLPPTLKELNRQSRIVRGGPMSVTDATPNPAECALGPTQRYSIDIETPHGGLGFRCAQSIAPRFHDEAAGRP